MIPHWLNATAAFVGIFLIGYLVGCFCGWWAKFIADQLDAGRLR